MRLRQRAAQRPAVGTFQRHRSAIRRIACCTSFMLRELRLPTAAVHLFSQAECWGWARCSCPAPARLWAAASRGAAAAAPSTQKLCSAAAWRAPLAGCRSAPSHVQHAWCRPGRPHSHHSRLRILPPRASSGRMQQRPRPAAQRDLGGAEEAALPRAGIAACVTPGCRPRPPSRPWASPSQLPHLCSQCCQCHAPCHRCSWGQQQRWRCRPLLGEWHATPPPCSPPPRQRWPSHHTSGSLWCQQAACHAARCSQRRRQLHR